MAHFLCHVYCYRTSCDLRIVGQHLCSEAVFCHDNRMENSRTEAQHYATCGSSVVWVWVPLAALARAVYAAAIFDVKVQFTSREKK